MCSFCKQSFLLLFCKPLLLTSLSDPVTLKISDRLKYTTQTINTFFLRCLPRYIYIL